MITTNRLTKSPWLWETTSTTIWMKKVMHASVHAINVNEKSFLRKDQKKDNQERLAKEELDSRDKHHKICSGILLTRLTSQFTLDQNSFRKWNWLNSILPIHLFHNKSSFIAVFWNYFLSSMKNRCNYLQFDWNYDARSNKSLCTIK